MARSASTDEERDTTFATNEMLENDGNSEETARVDYRGSNLLTDYDERNERNTSNDVDLASTTAATSGDSRNNHKRNLSNVELMEDFWTSAGNSACLDYSTPTVSSSKKTLNDNSQQLNNWDTSISSSTIASPVKTNREVMSPRASIVLPNLISSSSLPNDSNSESLISSTMSSKTSINNNNEEEEEGLSSKLHDEARITNWSSVLHLSKTSPHLAKYTGPDRWTALHHACNRRPPASVVEALLRAYPDALVEQDQKGWTPLHHACRFKACLDVVRLLLTLYPRLGKLAAGMRGNRGRTALYYAIRYDAPEGVVEMLLDVDSSVVLEKDRAGESPLSLIWDSFAASCSGRKAIQSCLTSEISSDSKVHERWKKVDLLLKSAFQPENKWRILHAICSISSSCHHTLFDVARAIHPQQIYERDEITKCTALHYAVSTQAPYHVIQTLVQDYPDAASKPDNTCQLPLHLAAESDKKKKHWVNDGLECIYYAFPGAIRKHDLYGRLPLHLAITSMSYPMIKENGMLPSVIMNLIDLYPEGAHQSQSDGRLPLHLIAEHAEEWNEECDAVYQAYPDAIKIPFGPQRLLPLHLSSISPDAKPSVLQKLLEHYPQAISIPDAQGRLPIHLACDAGKSWDNALSILHQANPSSLNIQCQNKFTPLHYAAYSPNTSNETITAMLNLNTKQATLFDKYNRLPLHLACLSGKSFENAILPILNAYPDAIYEVDLYNCLPFHLAALCNSAEEYENEMIPMQHDIEHVNTLFQLLLFSPSCLINVSRQS